MAISASTLLMIASVVALGVSLIALGMMITGMVTENYIMVVVAQILGAIVIVALFVIFAVFAVFSKVV